MTMILPDGIPSRISEFVSGERNFPFIEKDELVCIIYLYGKNRKVTGDMEIQEVSDLASRTARQIALEIENYRTSPGKIDSEFVRSKYINRQLQIVIEKRESQKASPAPPRQIDESSESAVEVKKMSYQDPSILSDCFSQHVSLHGQNHFFELFGPFKDSDLISDVRQSLSGRMVMMGFNRRDESELPFQHPLIPLYVRFRDQMGAKP